MYPKILFYEEVHRFPSAVSKSQGTKNNLDKFVFPESHMNIPGKKGRDLPAGGRGNGC